MIDESVLRKKSNPLQQLLSCIMDILAVIIARTVQFYLWLHVQALLRRQPIRKP